MAVKSHFSKTQSFKTSYAPTTITQYVSSRTGMRVVVVDQEGPKVNGYFTLATEIHDDSGAPHTLEHLCFMGSRNFKYKGVLDRLATRAYSDTNAWTATDHTAYTLDTAGWNGFAQILPIYLEHLILPTLTDNGCYTEVHHIDPEGNDAGVVYSEMQGIQNSQGELMDLRRKRLLFPEGDGFRYETGGMMEHLRVLTADRIREFHKDMYQPKNLCLILVGAVEHDNLLEILDRFEDTILTDVPDINAPFKRPWVDSIQSPPISETVVESVPFPEEDESMGEVMVSFLGPSFSDNIETTVLAVLLRYLCGSSASILDNTLVEKEHLASGVYHSPSYQPTIVVNFYLTSVATEMLEKVEQRLIGLFQEVAAKSLDMTFLQECIEVERAQVKFQAESSAQFFSEPIIRDFLFGKRDGSTLRMDLESMEEYDVVEKWEEAKWKHYIVKWFAEGKHISLLGVPSEELSNKLEKDEKERVEAQKEKLGENGLKRLAERLEQAKAENNKEIPRGFLEKYKVPDPTLIRFIKTETARSGTAKKIGIPDTDIQKRIDQTEGDASLFIQFEHVPSNFAFVEIMIGTEAVPIHLRPLLDIYAENFFTTPVLRDGKKIEFEQIVRELEKDTVAYALGSGGSLGNSEALTLSYRVEVEKYEKAILKIREMMFASIFDLERITSTLMRLLAEVPEEKRSGSDMVISISSMIKTAPASITRAGNVLTRGPYLKLVKKLLQSNPQAIITQFEEIRTLLCRPENFRVLVVANVERLKDPVGAWKGLVKDFDKSRPLIPLETPYSRLSDIGRNPANATYVVPMPTVDSSFLITSTKGPNTFFDPKVPAIMVTLSYLNAVEGPLWNAVRGTGLAYGTTLRHVVERGSVTLDVYRSPDAFKAFKATQKVLEDFLSGTTVIDSLAFEGAISSIVLSFANSEATMASAAQTSFVRQVVRALPKDWPTVILGKVKQVTLEDMKGVMQNVLMPLFKAESSIQVLTCAPLMQESLVKDLQSSGFKPEIKTLAAFEDDYGYGKENGLSDAEDDDEAEEDDGDENSDDDD